MEQSVADFYDELADNYHLNYEDWDAGIQRQSQVLQRVIDEAGARVLDCCCGIGTQALGLASRGHRVWGTDISALAIARARREAHNRAVEVSLAVADMRALPFGAQRFDVVLCADNGLPHLLDVPEVTRALRQMRRVLRPGGRLIVSIRDYDALRRDRPTASPVRAVGSGTSRAVTFQLWHWLDDTQLYDLEHFTLWPAANGWQVRHARSRYWAISREQLSDVARDSGFINMEWLMPSSSGFFQPLLVATAG